MQNDSRTIFSNSPITSKTFYQSHNSYQTQSRIARIRENRMIYPQSTLTKIVFVTNAQGNGFRRQHYYSNQIPNGINLQQMMDRINKACYQKWRQSYQQLVRKQPLTKEQMVLKTLGVISIMIMAVFIYMVSSQHQQQQQNSSSSSSTNTIQWLLYSFVILMFLACIVSLLVVPQHQHDQNKDLEMVRAIKRQLIRLNQQQLRQNENQARFTWSCHFDCLWIACEFH